MNLTFFPIVWKQLAAKMKGILNVVEVDCEENGELCRRETVDGYPMIFLYVVTLFPAKVSYSGDS